MIPDKALESLAPCLVGRDGKPLVRNGVIDSQALESYLSEDELLDEEDEADMSLLPQNVRRLLHVTFKHSFRNVSETQHVRHSPVLFVVSESEPCILIGIVKRRGHTPTANKTRFNHSFSVF